MKKLLLIISIFIVAGAVWFMQPSSNKTDEFSEIKVSGTLYTSMLVLIAEKQGFFTEEKLKVDYLEVLSSTNAMQNLIAKNSDIGVLVDTSIGFIGFQENVPFKVVASNEVLYNVSLFGRKDRGIHTPQDLIGKTIGVQPTTSAHLGMVRFLEHHGISQDDIKVNYLTSPVAVHKAIISGEIDAAVVWSPYRYYALQELADNATDFVDDMELYRVNIFLAAHNDVINNRREDVNKFLRALRKAELYAKKHPKKTNAHIAERTGLKLEVLNSFLDGAVLEVFFNKEHIALAEANGEWIRTTQKGFIGKDLPNYENIFDFSFIQELNGK